MKVEQLRIFDVLSTHFKMRLNHPDGLTILNLLYYSILIFIIKKLTQINKLPTDRNDICQLKKISDEL